MQRCPCSHYLVFQGYSHHITTSIFQYLEGIDHTLLEEEEEGANWQVEGGERE
jgi:hypothetical protein